MTFEIQRTLLDRAISYVAPKWGADRMRARASLAVMEPYVGASTVRRTMRTWATSSGSPAADQADAHTTLRDRSMDLFRNSPIARGALRTMQTHAVGSGLDVQPQIDRDFLGLSDEKADALEAQIRREWGLFAHNRECDAARKLNFGGLQALALLSTAMQGDCFALLPMFQRKGSPYTLKVQLEEGARVQNPPHKMEDENCALGVQVDDHGAATSYWFTKKHPGAINTVATQDDYVQVPAFGDKTGRPNVLALMHLDRPGQRRGDPLLTPVIETLKQLERYSDAELQAAVIAAAFTVFIKTEAPEAPLTGEMGEEDIAGEDTEAGSLEREELKLASGQVVGLAPGESIDIANPSRPNAQFDSFFRAMLEEVAVGLSIPVEVLMKQFKASYSASKASLEEAWRFFMFWREWLIFAFCQPIYVEWMHEAVLLGRLGLPGFLNDPLIAQAYSGTVWVGRGKYSLDPTKDAEAWGALMNMGITTGEKVTREYDGGDFMANLRQRGKEERLRAKENLTYEAVGERERIVQEDQGDKPEKGDQEDQ